MPNLPNISSSISPHTIWLTPKRLKLAIVNWLLFSAVFLSGTILSQNATAIAQDYFQLKAIDIGEGLSTQVIRKTFQDSSGFVWILTQRGTYRYDGNKTKRFLHNPDMAGSISSNSPTDIVEDRNGTIWISTAGGGLNRYNPASDTFTTINSNSDVTVLKDDRLSTLLTSNAPLDNYVYSLFVDDKNHIWLGYDNALSIFDTATQTFLHHRQKQSTAGRELTVNAFTQTPKGDVLIGTFGSGVLRARINNLPDARVDIAPISEIPYRSVTSLLIDSKMQLWLGTSDSGVILYPADKQQEFDFSSPQQFYTLAAPFIISLLEDNIGTIWVGTNTGLAARFSEDSEFLLFDALNSNLPNDKIMNTMQDHTGLLWISTQYGLAQGFQSAFSSITPGIEAAQNSINCFAMTDDGILWIGTDAGLLQRKVGISRSELPSDSVLLADMKIMSLLADKNTLWIGSANNGLFKLDTNTLELTQYRRGDKPSSLSNNGITSLLKTRSGALLVGTWGGGLNVMQPGENNFVRYRASQTNPDSLSSDDVIALNQDSDGAIWIGTSNGLSRLYPKEGKITRLTSLNSAMSLSSNIILALHEDQDKNLWVGTDRGINKWSHAERIKNTPLFQRFHDADYHPNSNIYGITSDARGDIWFSHGSGITQLTGTSRDAIQHSSATDFNNNNFNHGAVLRALNNQLIFGGNNGYNLINPGLKVNHGEKPPLHITGISVLGEAVKFDRPYHHLRELKISYQDYLISFDFSLMSYYNLQDRRYRYKLDGFDPEWIVINSGHTATYTNIPPGRYSLQVEASLGNDQWYNDNSINLPVIVKPPIWQSPLAYGAYMFMATLMLVYIFFRQNLRREEERRRQAELEHQVFIRTQELERARVTAEQANQAKSNFLATVSHEIRTPLHGIIGMTELLSTTNLNQQQQNFTATAYESGQALLHLINDILDYSKIEASKTVLEVTDFDINRLLDEVCYLQCEPAEKKGIALCSHPDPSITHYMSGDVTRVRQIMTNMLSNAIKFTPEGSVVFSVAAGTGEGNQGFTLVLKDTGIGMDEETQAVVFEAFTQADASTTRRYGGTGLGLSILRKNVELMDGKIDLESSPKVGTTISIELPLISGPTLPKLAPVLKGLSLEYQVDDEASRCMLQQHLDLLGVSYCPIETAPEATDIGICILDLRDSPAIETFVKRYEHLILLTSPSQSVQFRHASNITTIIVPLTSENLHTALLTATQPIDAPQQLTDTTLSEDIEHARVLIAEDMEVNQKIAEAMLSMIGCSIDIVDNGQHAVEHFMKNSYDIVLMDFQMPVLDGIEATRAIRAYENENALVPTPIIALTAGLNTLHKEQSVAVGMTDYLTKPYSLQDLQSIIDLYVGAHSTSRNTRPFPATANTGTEKEERGKVINEQTIDNILAISPDGDTELLRQVFEGFCTQSRDKIHCLSQASANSNLTDIAKSAHAIKSMSANMGAELLQFISESIESDAQRYAKIPDPKSIDAVKRAYEQFIQAFSQRYL